MVTTTDTESDELYEHFQDAEVLVTNPFWPVYADKEGLDQAPSEERAASIGERRAAWRV